MYKHLSSAFMVAAVTICVATSWTIVDRFDRTFSAHKQVSVNSGLKSDRLITASLVQVVESRDKANRSEYARPVQTAERQRKSDFLVATAYTRLQNQRVVADAKGPALTLARAVMPKPIKPKQNIVVASVEPLVFVPVSAGHARRTNVAAESPGTSRLSP